MVIVGSNPACRRTVFRASLLKRIWIRLNPNLSEYQRGVRLRLLTLSSTFVVVLVLVVVKIIMKASKVG